MQDTFARATHSAKRARDDRVSCIQIFCLPARRSTQTNFVDFEALKLLFARFFTNLLVMVSFLFFLDEIYFPGFPGRVQTLARSELTLKQLCNCAESREAEIRLSNKMLLHQIVTWHDNWRWYSSVWGSLEQSLLPTVDGGRWGGRWERRWQFFNG